MISLAVQTHESAPVLVVVSHSHGRAFYFFHVNRMVSGVDPNIPVSALVKAPLLILAMPGHEALEVMVWELPLITGGSYCV